jgi:UDP-3-O-[3-hydroxymyristoyl] glucosamine N-acyltransferase
MKLSTFIDHLNFKFPYRFVNEMEFNFFAIPSNNINQSHAIFVQSESYLNKLSLFTTMIITTENIYNKISSEYNGGFLIVDNPKLVFFLCHNYATSLPNYRKASFLSIIDSTASVSSTAKISPYNVNIGENVIIEDFVVIYPNVTIGKNSIIRSGTIIGGTGFEFKALNNKNFLVYHEGSVIIQDDVEIQHNCVIDRAIFPFDSTFIGSNTKLDNFVHIAHAVKIYESVLIAAGAIIAGRTLIGSKTWIGPGAIISNGLKIGSNCRINIGSVLTNDIPNNHSSTGNFAIDHTKFMLNHIKLKKGL